MFVKDSTVYRKVYVRKNGTRYFVKAGKRVDVGQNARVVSTKPSSGCPDGKERLPSGRCGKKCVPPKKRNPETGRCKKPRQQPSRMAVRRTPTPVRRSSSPVRRSSSPVRPPIPVRGLPAPVRRTPSPVRGIPASARGIPTPPRRTPTPPRRTPTPPRRTPTPPRRTPTPPRRTPTPVRFPKLLDLSEGMYYITKGKEEKLIKEGLKKIIEEKKLATGDILYIGSSIASRPQYGYYFVDHKKANKVISDEGLYAIDPFDDELYDEVMDGYKSMLRSPSLAYDKIKTKVMAHLRKISE